MNDTRLTASEVSIEKPLTVSFYKISWAVLIFLSVYVGYFSHLDALGLIGPDEPRYVWVAREMAETGDWVTPRLYSRPWFEKPILYYWGAAASFKLFGVSEVTARLPSAMAALLATLALAWLALRLAGWETARWVLLLLPSSVAMLGFAHAASPDTLFSAMLAVAMVCAAVALGLAPLYANERQFAELAEEEESAGVFEVLTSSRKSLSPGESPPEETPPKKDIRYLSLALFGFFLGAAVLAKGPAAIILAGGATLLWMAFTRRWRDSLWLVHPIAVATFLVTALPWYVLCARRNPDFFRVFIIEHNFNRYLTPEFQHIQPFWYYVPITIVALLPWAFWLGWYGFGEARVFVTPLQRAQLLFLSSWALFPVLFFSLSKSKLPGYILPGVPAFIFLISLAVTHALKTKASLAKYALVSTGAFFLTCASWALFSKLQLSGTLVYLYVISAAGGGLLVISAGLAKRTRAALIAAVTSHLFLVTQLYVSVAKLDPQFSARVAAAQIGTSRAATTYSFKLQRSWQYQLSFYLHREILEWDGSIPGEAIVVTSTKHLAELRNSAKITGVLYNGSPQAQIVTVRPLANSVAGSGQPR